MDRRERVSLPWLSRRSFCSARCSPGCWGCVVPDVAALYIDPCGPYPALLGTDACWPKERDAKLYAGPHPIVAHPDCGPWSKLRHMCSKQDRTCGPVAVEQVRKYRGVLEHPEHSALFSELELPKPEGRSKSVGFDSWGGRTYQVDQCDWGHRCRKPTWLYVVAPFAVHDWLFRRLNWQRGTGTPTHCVCTGPRQSQRLPVATKAVKRQTPEPFARLLIEIARRCAA